MQKPSTCSIPGDAKPTWTETSSPLDLEIFLVQLGEQLTFLELATLANGKLFYHSGDTESQFSFADCIDNPGKLPDALAL